MTSWFISWISVWILSLISYFMFKEPMWSLWQIWIATSVFAIYLKMCELP